MMHKMVDGVQVEMTPEEEAEIQAEWDANATAAALVKYKIQRASAYASVADQLDMQYKDAINGTKTWENHIALIKAMYPKPAQ
jgi:hypothetical protein